MLLVLSCLLACLVRSGFADFADENGTCTKDSDKQYVKVGISDKDRDYLLKFHNDLRQKVAEGNQKVADGNLPEACCMRKMEWDEGLAQDAQTYVKRCNTKSWSPEGRHYSQSVYYFYNDDKEDLEEPDWTNFVDYHSDFKDALTTKDRKPFVKNNAYNGFTRMIWQDTDKIGCAESLAYDTDEEEWYTYYTCYYSKPGNVKGGTMCYAKGEQECKCDLNCKQCSLNIDPVYPNLCSVNKKPKC